MPTTGILNVVMGASSFLGVVGLIAYLYFSQLVSRAEGSVRKSLEGESLFNAEQVLKVLSQFQDDLSRLEALKTLTNYDTARATALLQKVRSNIDVSRLSQIKSKHYRQIAIISGTFFLLLSGVTFAYSRSALSPQPADTKHREGSPTNAGTLPTGSDQKTGPSGPVLNPTLPNQSGTVEISSHGTLRTTKNPPKPSVLKNEAKISAPVIEHRELRCFVSDAPLVHLGTEGYRWTAQLKRVALSPGRVSGNLSLQVVLEVSLTEAKGEYANRNPAVSLSLLLPSQSTPAKETEIPTMTEGETKDVAVSFQVPASAAVDNLMIWDKYLGRVEILYAAD